MFDWMYRHRACDSEISYLRQQVLYLQSKCDRLTEALVRKEQSIVVKLPDAPQTIASHVPVIIQGIPPVMPTEPPNTWARGDSWMGSQKIASPVREAKINAPEGY